MDYLNTDIDIQKVKRALQGKGATPQQRQALHEIENGYEMMDRECQKLIDRTKNAIFRLYRRRMLEQKNFSSQAYRLGIMLAMKARGIDFQIKHEEKLQERMEIQKRLERRKEAIRLATNA